MKTLINDLFSQSKCDFCEQLIPDFVMEEHLEECQARLIFLFIHGGKYKGVSSQVNILFIHGGKYKGVSSQVNILFIHGGKYKGVLSQVNIFT